MTERLQERPAGYSFLIDQYNLDVIPNWHASSISQASTIHITESVDQIKTTYPSVYWPGESLGDHLGFALRYDGINLGILAALFAKISKAELVDWIASKPTGKSTRRIWFLYEMLTGSILALPDLKTGNYIELLDSNHYFTVNQGTRIRRQRILNNLLGDRSFCPIVRKTARLADSKAIDFKQKCDQVLSAYPKELLHRAAGYLYRKETKTSFQIENIKPSVSRIEKYVGLLEMASLQDFCEKSLLIDLQNRIVDSRFADKGYRTIQNYIGQSIAFQKQIIHYICPRPNVIADLMSGLLCSHKIMKNGHVPTLIHAAIIAYGFVFLHPFQDGNGRIHRFLIHNILSIRQAVPKGLICPISAVMLKYTSLYERSLEAFSKPVMRLVEYELDELGQMSVLTKTDNFYRYIDMTAQAEALLDFIHLTIDHELVYELNFLSKYDSTKKAIQTIIDMPDQKIDLFIQLCLQNNGQLSRGKRESHFSFLADHEVTAMEEAVRTGYGQNLPDHVVNADEPADL